MKIIITFLMFYIVEYILTTSLFATFLRISFFILNFAEKKRYIGHRDARSILAADLLALLALVGNLTLILNHDAG